MERVTLEYAQTIIHQYLPEARVARVRLSQAIGHVLVEDVVAHFSQPPFARSAMDGYAIRRADYVAGERLDVVGEIDAGDTKRYEISSPCAYRIMTGAAVPVGADMVVPQEMTDYDEAHVLIHQLPKMSNIAPVGEDFQTGDVLVKKGQQLFASQLACIASVGYAKVPVYQKPRVAIVTTGDEVVEPGDKLEWGQIYDTNTIYLQARVEELHGEVTHLIRVNDDVDLIARMMKKLVGQVDLIITVGGVSVGKKDCLERAILQLHGEVVFHGIHIKPGMPTMFSLVKETPVLSLSGNPFAASALFEYLYPFHQQMTLHAPLCGSYERKRPQMRIVRGVFDGSQVTLFTNQKNGTTSSGANANCLVELPQGDEPLTSGALLTVKLL